MLLSFIIVSLEYKKILIIQQRHNIGRNFFEQLHDVLLFYTRSSLRLQKQKTILSLHEKNENYVERQKKQQKRVKHQKSAAFLHIICPFYFLFFSTKIKNLYLRKHIRTAYKYYSYHLTQKFI